MFDHDESYPSPNAGGSSQRDKAIFHVDLDAFFASCEERENPHFRGKPVPVIVGADPKQGKGRGVVSTANYIARKFGVHSSMPISQAWRFCPQAIFLPLNGALYSRVSGSVMRILQDFTRKYNGKFEQVSIDEAYLDLAKHLSRPPNNSNGRLSCWEENVGEEIKGEILSNEKITASVGIGPNMLVAKMACESQKPDGLAVVKPEDVNKFLDPLPVRKLFGVGPTTERELRKFNIKTVADLRKLSQATLCEAFGKHGVSL